MIVQLIPIVIQSGALWKVFDFFVEALGSAVEVLADRFQVAEFEDMKGITISPLSALTYTIPLVWQEIG